VSTFRPTERPDDWAELDASLREALSKVGGRVEGHVEYQNRPVEWIVEKLGIPEETLRWSKSNGFEAHVWDGTPDPLVAVLHGLADGEDVGVESGTGTGKTFLAACVTLWFLACFPDSIVITAAPKQDQLRLHLWNEIGRLWFRFKRLFPAATLLDGKVRMLGGVEERETWTATAFVCGVGADEESATKAQGFHAEHMLIITEETPGIHSAIMTAFANTRTDAHNLHLALGNPDNRLDELHRFCTRPSVRHVRVSALDHPNVVMGEALIPGAVSRKRIKERGLEYGEDSALYRSRVRGISPTEARDALIRFQSCEEAADRLGLVEYRQGPGALGVDVANSEHGDKAAIARGVGACLLDVTTRACPDSVQLGIEVGVLIRADGIDPRRVGIDAVGVGAGTVGRLREMGYAVRPLNGGARALGAADAEARARTGHSVPSFERFANLRAAMWWKLRQDLERGHIALVDDPELFQDLATPTWFTRNGSIYVEPKEDIRRRLGRSPDKGDAAVMWNWVRERPTHMKPEPQNTPSRNFDHGVERFTQKWKLAQQAQLSGDSAWW